MPVIQPIIGGSSVLTPIPKWSGKFGMSFDSELFKTDPTGCLVYTDDCADYTPVSGPGSSLARCSTIGSWVMDSDGTSTNPLLNACFYATFEDGELYELLNPQNLAQRLAIWGGTGWVPMVGSSSITTNDVMFCIPTIYLNSDSTSITISSNPNDGTAFAHTIDGTVYDYLAIGVYPANLTSNRLYSKSGAASTVSTTRATFRSAATAKTVNNGKAMVWNFYQWNLWRIITIFAMKSFNGQTRIGQGGYTYGARNGGTLMNAMGPFAGSTSRSASTSTGVKAFIENPWGHNYEFIDDFVNGLGTAGKCYIGQNSSPDDTNNNKVQISLPTGSGWGSSPSTDARTWGIPTAVSGSSTAYLCDYFYGNTGTSGYLGYVGGRSDNVSNGNAGPSYLSADTPVGYSYDYLGARLAFVFNV